MSRNHLDLAVLGATGAAGEQFLAALGESDLAVGTLRLFGSAARSPAVDTVEFRGKSQGVDPIGRLAGVKPDVAVLCVPPAVAGRIAPDLVARGVVVVDAGDATAGVLDAPLALPGVQEALPDGVAEKGAVRCPSAPGWLLARVLAPLVPRGLVACSGVLNVSACSRGRAGMEELSGQVVATLNQQDPPRRVFPDGLAFDTIPEDVPEDEWSSAERVAAEEAGVLAGLDPTRVAVQIATQPLFSGLSAGLHLRGVDVRAAEEAFAAVPELHAVSSTGRLRPRAVTGKAGVWWGRLRADPAGDGVHLWVVADNLGGPAGQVPLRVLRWLHAAGLLGAE